MAVCKSFKLTKKWLPNLTLSKAAILHPVFTIFLLLLIFFLLVRKLFNIPVALLSTLSLATIPAFISRTMAGQFDHDAITMLLYLFALYLFCRSWGTGKYDRFLFTFFSGAIMGFIGLIWQGVGFLIFIFAALHFLQLWLDEFQDKEVALFAVWCLPIFISLLFFTKVYIAHFTQPFAVITFGAPCLFLSISLVSMILSRNHQIASVLTWKERVPISFSISTIVFFVLILALFLFDKMAWLGNIVEHVFYPFGNNPVMRYISELQPPNIEIWWEWYGLFGFLVLGGVILLVYRAWELKGSQAFIHAGVLAFIFGGIIFSSAFSKSLISGYTLLDDMTLSLKISWLGLTILFPFSFLVIRYLGTRSNKMESLLKAIPKIDKPKLLILVCFFISLFMTRSAIRFNLFLAPFAAIVGSFCLVELYNRH